MFVKQPIPLDFLRLGPFIGPPDSKRDTENGGFLGGVLGKSRQLYPFVVFDAASESRRYTLFTDSERNRTKWKQMFEEAISVRTTYIDANKVCRLSVSLYITDAFSGQLFVFNVIADGYMRENTILVPSSARKNLSGKMISATTFSLYLDSYMIKILTLSLRR